MSSVDPNKFANEDKLYDNLQIVKSSLEKKVSEIYANIDRMSAVIKERKYKKTEDTDEYYDDDQYLWGFDGSGRPQIGADSIRKWDETQALLEDFFNDFTIVYPTGELRAPP